MMYAWWCLVWINPSLCSSQDVLVYMCGFFVRIVNFSHTVETEQPNATNFLFVFILCLSGSPKLIFTMCTYTLLAQGSLMCVQQSPLHFLHI